MFPFFKKMIIPALAIILVSYLFHHEEKPTGETLVIGLQSGYPPFEFMDQKGKIVGFDLEVGSKLAEMLGKTLVVQDMDFEGVILSLKQGRIDLILSGMNITPSRLKEIALIPYHGDTATSLSLIFWKEIPQGVKSLNDIASFGAISVQSGTIPEAFLAKFPEIQSKSFQGALATLIDVKYGKSIASLVEPDVAEYLQSQHPEIQILNIPMDEPVLGFGIGIKKENQELIAMVSDAVQKLKKSGELKALEDKWFKGREQ